MSRGWWDGYAMACADCYTAHHYGARQDDAGAWYAGECDTPCHREPLCLLLDGYDVADATGWVHDEDCCDDGCDGFSCEADHERDDDQYGRHEFSWSRCEGCGSTLGGARYRLAWRRLVVTP